MNTEEIERQLFTSEAVPQKEVVAHEPSEDEKYRKEQQKKKEDWD
jgi:hypothetical protein